MIPLATAPEMKEIDRITIEKIGISGLVLMENAGSGVVKIIESKYGNIENKSFLIVCGKGNNGGDGFVVARHLYNKGAKVKVLILKKQTELKGDAAINFRILSGIVRRTKKKEMLQIIAYRNIRQLSRFTKIDLIVDAIFGTGFFGKIPHDIESLIRWINKTNITTVSIDIPSGINADNGNVENIAVRADLVVTMGLKKVGLLVGKSVNYIGEIKTVDISIPRTLTAELKSKNLQVEREDIRRDLPLRHKTAHKYQLGKILVLAGSSGYTGAAAMAAQSAMKTGVGAVILCSPSNIYSILTKKLTEVIVQPLEATLEGSIGLCAYEKIRSFTKWADHLVVGCGLSVNQETIEVVLRILTNIDIPMLIDADGLKALSINPRILKKRKSKNLILTPHAGEFARLINLDTDEIEKDKINIAREFARENKLVLVLKGAPTITASPAGEVVINSTGNPGMATIGSGDVLAGIIGGLWGQGMNDFSAAYSGVYLHGLAGDLAKGKLGVKSLMATDIQKNISGAIMSIEKKEDKFENTF
jgi:ADP-dependent NAD(P)H-hydrate dehydratase / NAD(P)H-hydrate epimerase